MNPFRRLLLAAAMGLLLAPFAPAGTWYVRRDAPPGGDGSSWASAFQAVQDGLAAAQPGDEVWVARATYRPGTAASPRSVSFQLAGGVALYGGFAGTEASLAERDWIANPTVLSGDLLLDDAPGFVNRSDNCYHVVRAQGIGSVLDGFIVRGGNADGGGDDAQGGGIRGAGVTLRNLLVEENEASSSGGGLAGGVLVERSTFRANRAGFEGGGIAADSQAIQVVACKLLANEASYGAGLSIAFTMNGDSSMRDCLVVGNVATQGGGGMRLWYSGISVTSSTIAFNQAPGGGGVTMAGGFGVFFSNSILWGNTGNGSVLQQQGLLNFASSVATAIQGWTDPWNQDPRWSDPLGPDGVPGTADDDFTLSCVSPYIDRGSNPHAAAAGSTLDLAGNPRFADDPATPDLGAGSAPIIDLGPYEFVCACDGVVSYCTALPNSSGHSASISASGSTSLFANSLVLHVEGGPPLKNGLFFYGKLQAATPFGDGILCVGGSLYRLSVIQLDAGGAASFALDLARPPAGVGPGQVFEGSVWNFQFYFRDPLGGPFGWNFSDALAISFCR